MAEKKNEKKIVALMGKHLLSVAKCAGKDESRSVLMGIHVEADYQGRWELAATDSYKLMTLGTNVPPAGDFSFVLPPQAISGVKASDTVSLEYLEESNEVHVIRYLARGKGMAEATVKCPDGKFPNYKQLIPTDEIPLACYRMALSLSSTYTADVLKAIEQAFGSGTAVEIANAECKDVKKPNPVMVYAADKNYKARVVVMPLRCDGKSDFLGKPTPFGKAEERNRELRDELKAAKANADMWKAKALDAEKAKAEHGKEVAGASVGQIKALTDELEKVKAERDKFAEKFRVEKAKRVEQKGEPVDDAKVKELEAELAKARTELDEVWRENANLKATKKEPKEADEMATDTAAEVTLDTMKKWCEGKNLVATQKRPGCCIWVEGESKPYEAELKELGFRWAGKSRKAWYLSPQN